MTILNDLLRIASKRNVAGMARYGIRPAHPLGVSMKSIRSIAHSIEPDHQLALWLWQTGIHEARILATILDEPECVTAAQMNRWVRQLDSWDLCDQCCANLFERTPFAWKKCVEWSGSNLEFVRRSGFSLMARLALSDKHAPNSRFVVLLAHIRRGSGDERNLVKKAVSWALRQIGKRNPAMHRRAVALARKLAAGASPATRWVGRDALRELTRPDVAARVRQRRNAGRSDR
jgi:3-methyladenine DNA glycosylase AlkD